MDYIQALHDQDRTRMRDMMQSVDDATLTTAMDRVRDRLYQFMDLTNIEVTSQDRVTVTLQLQDKDGNVVTRMLDMERDSDTWRIRDPELH